MNRFSDLAYENLDTDSNVDTFSDTSSSARMETCQALYDFEPQQEDQLAIYAGMVSQESVSGGSRSIPMSLGIFFSSPI